MQASPLSTFRGLGLRLLALAVTIAVAMAGSAMADRAPAGIDPKREAAAVSEASAKRARGERVWCVPFARTASGVEIKGNAKLWWDRAAGIYDRGNTPVPGSVMAFRATKKMPMGHVAVVSKVVSDREILITHANWSRNKISRDMVVIDVSKGNDWSAVRVQSQPESLGRVYPVNGFIYPVRG